MSTKKFIVYRDEEYTTPWISFDVKIREFVKPLAKIESLIGISEIRYDKHGTWNWLKRFFSERVSGIDIGKGGIGIDFIEKKEENKARLRYFEEYASAWFKNFNKKVIPIRKSVRTSRVIV